MKFTVWDFFDNCEKIRSFLRICSQILKKLLTENFIFCAVIVDKISDNHTSTWVFSYKFAAYFQNTLFLRTPVDGYFWPM